MQGPAPPCLLLLLFPPAGRALASESTAVLIEKEEEQSAGRKCTAYKARTQGSPPVTMWNRALPGEPAGSRALQFFLLVGAEGVTLCSLLSALSVALCL